MIERRAYRALLHLLPGFRQAVAVLLLLQPLLKVVGIAEHLLLLLAQSLELLFCAAAGHPFRVSLDNLHGEVGEASGFEDAVLARGRELIERGVKGRAGRWCQTLSEFYRDEPFSGEQVDEVFLRW